MAAQADRDRAGYPLGDVAVVTVVGLAATLDPAAGILRGGTAQPRAGAQRLGRCQHQIPGAISRTSLPVSCPPPAAAIGLLGVQRGQQITQQVGQDAPGVLRDRVQE